MKRKSVNFDELEKDALEQQKSKGDLFVLASFGFWDIFLAGQLLSIFKFLLIIYKAFFKSRLHNVPGQTA